MRVFTAMMTTTKAREAKFWRMGKKTCGGDEARKNGIFTFSTTAFFHLFPQKVIGSGQPPLSDGFKDNYNWSFS